MRFVHIQSTHVLVSSQPSYLEVLERTEDLLDLSGHLALVSLDISLIGETLGSLELLKVTLDVGGVTLLVEAGGLETERVDDVVDDGDTVLKVLSGLLSRGVGSDIDISALLDLDHGALNLVGTANLLDIESIREELVAIRTNTSLKAKVLENRVPLNRQMRGMKEDVWGDRIVLEEGKRVAIEQGGRWGLKECMVEVISYGAIMSGVVLP